MLTFNLKNEWYEKIRSGKKTVEYREAKPYWSSRLKKCLGEFAHDEFFDKPKVGSSVEMLLDPEKCVLRLGYTKRYMTADISKISVVDGKYTDLHIDRPVYAIKLSNIKESAYS